MRTAIAEALTQGAGLADVERRLESMDLAPDLRDALWLFAWSEAQRLQDRPRPAAGVARAAKD